MRYRSAIGIRQRIDFAVKFTANFWNSSTDVSNRAPREASRLFLQSHARQVLHLP